MGKLPTERMGPRPEDGQGPAMGEAWLVIQMGGQSRPGPRLGRSCCGSHSRKRQAGALMAFPERKHGKVAGRDKGVAWAGPGRGSDTGVCPEFPEPPPCWPGRQVSGPAPLVLVPRAPALASASQECPAAESEGGPGGTEKERGRGGKRED